MKALKVAAVVLGLFLFFFVAVFGNAAENGGTDYSTWWNGMDAGEKRIALNGVLEGIQLSAVLMNSAGEKEYACFLIEVVESFLSIDVHLVIECVDIFYSYSDNKHTGLSWALVCVLKAVSEVGSAPEVKAAEGVL